MANSLYKVDTQLQYQELAERICMARVMEIRKLLDQAHAEAEAPIEILQRIRDVIERS